MCQSTRFLLASGSQFEPLGRQWWIRSHQRSIEPSSRQIFSQLCHHLRHQLVCLGPWYRPLESAYCVQFSEEPPVCQQLHELDSQQVVWFAVVHLSNLGYVTSGVHSQLTAEHLVVPFPYWSPAAVCTLLWGEPAQTPDLREVHWGGCSRSSRRHTPSGQLVVGSASRPLS